MRQLIWHVLGWGFTAAAAIWLYLRWTEVSGTTALGLAALTPLVFVPILGVILGAWRTGSRALQVSAVALSVLYLATFTNINAVVGCGPESADDEITVFTQNVLAGQGDPAAVRDEALSKGADVVVLQEAYPSLIETLETDPAMDPFAYRAIEAPAGLTIWSRWPLSDARLVHLDQAPQMVAEVESPHGTFTLYGIHTSAPIDGQAGAWAVEMTELATLGRSEPTVLAGDFNATNDHGQFRELLDEGWTDAHGPKGCGYDATWPADGPTLLRLDHVLVTDHFEVLALEVGEPNGSDHHSVTARFRLTG